MCASQTHKNHKNQEALSYGDTGTVRRPNELRIRKDTGNGASPKMRLIKYKPGQGTWPLVPLFFCDNASKKTCLKLLIRQDFCNIVGSSKLNNEIAGEK
jgi:hypothetical protein